MLLSNDERLFTWPLTQHVITAGWKYNDGSTHRAIDIRAAVGTPVYAAEDGTVSVVYHWSGKRTQCDTNSYGNFVKLKHANYKKYALETLYAHLSKTVVLPGQIVREGDLIGYSGDTGNVYGAHLHFETRLSGNRVNPLCWFDDDFSTASSAVYTYQKGEGPVKRPADKSYTVKIGPMSEGDYKAIKARADELGVSISKV